MVMRGWLCLKMMIDIVIEVRFRLLFGSRCKSCWAMCWRRSLMRVFRSGRLEVARSCLCVVDADVFCCCVSDGG